MHYCTPVYFRSPFFGMFTFGNSASNHCPYFYSLPVFYANSRLAVLLWRGVGKIDRLDLRKRKAPRAALERNQGNTPDLCRL
jgi:hypothetical protein